MITSHSKFHGLLCYCSQEKKKMEEWMIHGKSVHSGHFSVVNGEQKGELSAKM